MKGNTKSEKIQKQIQNTKSESLHKAHGHNKWVFVATYSPDI
jgi:hypothetical protein